jgi:tetratricopeptide (TPR) repeat protein
MNDTTGTQGLAYAIGAFTVIGMTALLSGIILFTTFGGSMVEGLDERLGEVLMNRGIRLEAAGEYASAREAYSRALGQNFYGPQNRAMTCKRLGALYWNEGRYDAAFTYLQKASEFDPPIISAFEPLADSYIQLLRFDEAARTVQRWTETAQRLDIQEEVAKAHYHRGRVAVQRGDAQAAIEAFNAALAAGGDNRSLYELATLNYEAGNYEATLEYIDQYLQSGGGPRADVLRDLRKHAQWKRDGAV